MAVIKWSPTFPVPGTLGQGVGVAAPIKYGGAGTLHGLMIQNAVVTITDRRFYISKNNVVFAEHSIRAGDEKRFIALEEPIVASDVFRIRYESDGTPDFTIAPIYVALAADIAPSNALRDYGANRATDLAALTETLIGGADAASRADQMAAGERDSRFLDGRFVRFTKAASASAVSWRDTTVGRTGTNWYVRCAIARTGVADGAALQDSYVGPLFMSTSTTEGYALLMQNQNTVSTAQGLYHFTGSTLTSILAGSTSVVAADAVIVMEALAEDGTFWCSINRAAGSLARNVTITAAGALGYYAVDASTDVTTADYRIGSTLWMMV